MSKPTFAILPQISHYHTRSWEQEIQESSRDDLEDLIDLCTRGRRSWMSDARRLRSKGIPPTTELNMAWKYHRHLMMLLRAQREIEQNEPQQAALF